jgi:hypothetical protein
MGMKYGRYEKQMQPKKRPWEIHPIWRGIGCLLLILIPILSYAGAVLLVKANVDHRWVPAPFELMRTVDIPIVLISIDHLFANLMVAVLLMLIGFGILMMFYSLLYSVLGPPRYGPLDSEPIRTPPKRSVVKRR